jgi:cytochrome c oxidase subunit IV
MAHSENAQTQNSGLKNPAVKRVLVVTAILSGLTIVEFILAFYYPPNMSRNVLFAILTIFKAFYIVAEFMHLKHEVKSLIWSIVIPLAFILWFIVALLTEGGAHFLK